MSLHQAPEVPRACALRGAGVVIGRIRLHHLDFVGIVTDCVVKMLFCFAGIQGFSCTCFALVRAKSKNQKSVESQLEPKKKIDGAQAPLIWLSCSLRFLCSLCKFVRAAIRSANFGLKGRRSLRPRALSPIDLSFLVRGC